MKRNLVLAVGSLAFIALSSLSANEAGHSGKHWGYLGDVSPAHWGELNEKFKTCGVGKEQSPINIVPTKDVNSSFRFQL